MQVAETHVENRARVDGVSISGHHLRRDEVLRSASPLAVAEEVERQVVGLESCVASDEPLCLAQVVVAAEADLIVVAADRRIFFPVLGPPPAGHGRLGVDGEVEIFSGDGADPIGWNDVAGELQTIRHRAAVAIVTAITRIGDTALRPWVIDRHHGASGHVAVVGEISGFHGRGRHRAPEQHTFAIAVPFVARKEEQLVSEHRPAQHAAEVVLHERRLVEAGALAEERVRVQRLVAVIFEHGCRGSCCSRTATPC